MAGSYPYTLACNGPGGNATAIATLLATNVKASSYENKNSIGATTVSLPNSGVNAFALGDFFRDGSMSLVTHTLEYDVSNPATYGVRGHIHFYKSQAGRWVDTTSQLLADPVGCTHPRKAIVADFNNDGVPDVFFACHGVDAAPFPGEQPHLLLSQADGTYRNVTLPTTCYCHSASAADVTGDGYADILVTDTSVAKMPYFLINNGDGSFTPDYGRLPTAVANKQIYTAELIDFQQRGKYDVFLGGNEPGTTSFAASEFSSRLFPNDGQGKFVTTSPVSLYSTSYGLALDIVFQNNFVYLLKVNNAYTSSQVVKIAYPSTTETVLYSHSGVYASVGSSWLDWILLSNGQIVGQNAAYVVSFGL